VEDWLEHYIEHGWAPAQWEHHPDVIQDAFGVMGFEPRLKECFSNCQKFTLDSKRYGLDIEVEYHEGYVISIIPFEHAWLTFEGEVLDLTLGPDKVVEYLDSYTYSREEIRESVQKDMRYSPLTSYQKFHQISPWGDGYFGD